jgi:DNA-directed RNA polymerase subunit RPC12/RpoP
LTFTPGDHEIECPYCGDLINLKTTDILNRPTPLVSTIRLQRKILARHWNEIDRVLSCDACGARLTMTHHLARKCAFCGSANVLVEDPQIALEQPDGFLPFEINKRDVDKAIRREKPSILWDYRGWDRFRRMKVQNLLGVYMPFWVFDGVVNPMWAWLREDGTLARTNSPGSEIDFNNIIFPGTDRPHPSLLDDVSEYDMSKLVMYEPKLLADWSAMLYNIDVEIAVEDAYDAMIALAHQKLGPPVLAGVDVPEGSRAVRTLQVSHTTYQLVLLPLWIARLTSEDTDAVALVNGQTGASIFRMRYRD